MRFIAHSKLSASHGWALNEVFPSLVQHPSRQVYMNIAHTAKSLRDFPVVRCRQAPSISHEQMSLTRLFQNKRDSHFQASLNGCLFYFETTYVALFISNLGSLARYRLHPHAHAGATCWHWRNWLFNCCYSSLCCKEA